MKTCGRNAKMLRIEKSMTQKELANALDINVATIVRFERGMFPSVDVVLAYSNFFNTTTDTILDRTSIFLPKMSDNVEQIEVAE